MSAYTSIIVNCRSGSTERQRLSRQDLLGLGRCGLYWRRPQGLCTSTLCWLSRPGASTIARRPSESGDGAGPAGASLAGWTLAGRGLPSLSLQLTSPAPERAAGQCRTRRRRRRRLAAIKDLVMEQHEDSCLRLGRPGRHRRPATSPAPTHSPLTSNTAIHQVHWARGWSDRNCHPTFTSR